MRVCTGVGMTDGVNRMNHNIPVETLIDAYNKSYEFPMVTNLGHDRTRPIGYTMLDGIYFEPGKAYLNIRTYIAESKNDIEKVNTISKNIDRKLFCEEHIQELERLYSQLGSLRSKKSVIVPTGQAVAIMDKGIVFRVFPEISNCMKEGLISINELEPVYSKNTENGEISIPIPGVYKRGNYLVFAHHFMRRNLSVFNSLNDSFFWAFEKLRGKEEVELQIAIDPDMIGLLGTQSAELEYQYWWGPKFNNDLTAIEAGVTVHRQEEAQKDWSNIYETQFYWHIQDDRNTFECEELCNRENIYDSEKSFFGCRYVHSMVDKKVGVPIHLDGAIRIYNDIQMLNRMETGHDISKCGKEMDYYKLWRIDGAISVDIWKELITHYFRDNFLVGEYFGGQDEKYEQIIEEESTHHNVIIESDKYVPTDMKSGDGIRMFYRRHIFFDIPEDRDLKVINHEFILFPNGEKYKYIEADAITYLKLLIKKEAKLRIPYTPMIAFEDMVFNFPTLYCRNKSVFKMVLDSFLELCSVWKKKGDNRLASLGIMLAENTESVIEVSFAGHIDDFIYVLSKTDPGCFQSIDAWIKNLYEINNSLIGDNFEPLRQTLISSGRLWFKRVFADEMSIRKYKMNSNTMGLEIMLPISEGMHLRNNKIVLAPVYRIKETKCSRCGRNYLTCNCVKFIEEDVAEKVIISDYIGMVWTTRNCCFPDAVFNLKKH